MAPLARGGFGAVYVAEQLTTERRVALKVLARYSEHVSVDRLLAEARVTSRILSDHIVQVIDAGVDQATSEVFVVMELLRGITLDEHLMQHGALPPREVAEYLRQVAVGLDKTHGHLDRNGRPTPIVHRDLKPSNIFLTARDDGQPLLKILDFGAAKVLSLTTKASGMVRGTPQFMASEQALGEPCTAATDIWAFGLIAFNLLTGSSYWLTVQRDEGTEAQLFAEILTLPLDAASQRARQLGLSLELPPAFDRWFASCVNRDPAQRFASAGQAAAELSRLLGVEPTRLSETPHRSPPAAAIGVNHHRSEAQQLEIQSVAALSRTPPLAHPSRIRWSLATLGIVVAGSAGAAAVVLWKRAPVVTPSLSSISASPQRSGSNVAGPTQREVPPPVPPSAAPSAAPAVSAQSSARPATPATPSGRAPNSEKRAPSSARPVAPLKTSAASHDPYEQR
ncbi:MAG TPA: serine/threonine-protein kinase [Polyangiaceae bacterium]|nr:serine/threonine-protein kinase [Polyangiaceae bacterium]